MSLKGKILSRITAGQYCPKTGEEFRRLPDELRCSECGGELELRATIDGGADLGHK